MENIVVRGARTHNLKNITVSIPRDQLCVITGLSGSGKSSLAFDTLYAEGQRRYVESLSAYARQFLQLMDKPDVDSIEGLSPAISIEQKSTSHNPRSTVGTITEIHDYLRLLFARTGEARCPEHGTPLKAQTVSQMVDQTLAYPEGTKLMIMAPVIRSRKGEYKQLLGEMAQQGFIRARIDGEICDPSDPPELKLHIKHNIEIVIDRFKVKSELKQRIAESFETALKLSDGLAMLVPMDDHKPEEEITLSAKYSCPICGYSIPEIEPRNFSFNNPHGACPRCDGLGKLMVFSEHKLIKNPEKTLDEGAIALWDKVSWRYYRTLVPACNAAGIDLFTPFKDLPREQQLYVLYGDPQVRRNTVNVNLTSDPMHEALKSGFNATVEQMHPPYSPESEQQMQDRLDEQTARLSFNQGDAPEAIDIGVGESLAADENAVSNRRTKGNKSKATRAKGTLKHQDHKVSEQIVVVQDTLSSNYTHASAEQMHTMEQAQGSFIGCIPYLERQVLESESENYQALLQTFMVSEICPECHGARLKKAYRHVFVGGKSLPEINEMSISEAYDFFTHLTLGQQDTKIAERILKEVRERLMFLKNVGLGYLTLARSAETLSGGEAQRIRLASQIGAGLVGVMYILDEPSIGLHQRDNQRLLDALKHLRDLGNTVIVVEHDEDAIRQADYIVDIGPLAGVHGGQVVTCGTPEKVMQNLQSLTADYLTGRKQIAIPQPRTPISQHFLTLKGCHGNNLKNVDVSIPLGNLVVITGVSGSGKSTLINDTLVPMVASHLKGSEGSTELRDPSFKCSLIQGLEHIDKLICIDQSPIGRTPRSNPATYIGLFNGIRELFAQTEGARARGYGPGRFSFNVKGGRCEACQGDGTIRVEMHFLPDVYVQCEQCHGKRYNRETLEITYKGKNISDVLDMTVEEAYEFFNAIPPLKRKLQALMDVGLSYITLGQSALTFSGGEAQRIKLAKELSKVATKRTLYVLDEPTTGLHFHDVKQLLDMLLRLRDEGNTVVIIEHNLDVIKSADYIIDLGPEGGIGGGQIIATGTPEEIAQTTGSFTGEFLKPILLKAGTLTEDSRAEAQDNLASEDADKSAQTTTTSKAKTKSRKRTAAKAPSQIPTEEREPSSEPASTSAQETIAAQDAKPKFKRKVVSQAQAATQIETQVKSTVKTRKATLKPAAKKTDQAAKTTK